tara:strand:+ start:179 stop:835 length:657 start_codon:yes stop_codon:yes gene_type:complete
MKKLLSSIILASMFLSSAALAGVNLGVTLGEQGYYALGTEKSNPGGPNETHTTEAGAFGENLEEIFVEYDAGGVVLGVAYMPNDVETPENVNNQDGTENKVKAEFSDFTTVYAIVPFTFLPTEGLYGKIGYIEADIISIESGMTSSYPNASTEGYTVGLGYQKNTDNGIFIRLEASAATYENVSVTSSTASTAAGEKNQVNIEDMMTARYQLSIGKSF